MSDYEFDAIVIGSGVSGGWAAKELTEKGMKVLMLDRGRMVEHSADYPYEGTGPWEQPYRGQTPPALLENDYYASRYGGAGQTAVKGFMNNDRLNPYAYKGRSGISLGTPRHGRRQVDDLGARIASLRAAGFRGQWQGRPRQ